jgi:MFS family permease
MRASRIGWALGVGRLGGIVAPMLGGWLLSSGVAPPRIFLTGCVFAVIAAIATALLRVHTSFAKPLAVEEAIT